jgi:hypothetical protein
VFLETAFLLLQALRGAALSCLHAMRLALKPVSSAWLQAATGYSDKTVTRALQKLLELQFVHYSESEAGWVLAQSTVLDQFFDPYPRKNSGETALESLESESDLSNSSEQEKRVFPDSGQTEFLGQLEVEKLLPAIQELFGEPLLLPRGLGLDPGDLLSLAAEKQHKRQRLRYPARAICGSLKRRRSPDLQYHERPWDFLPAWFLERIGLDATDGLAEIEDQEPGDVLPSPQEKISPVDQASLDQAVSPGSRLTACQAWEEACRQVRGNLPPAVYARFLHEAVAVEFDSQHGLLAVTAPDAEARQWLDGRLRFNLERELRLLSGRGVRLEVRGPPEKD